MKWWKLRLEQRTRAVQLKEAMEYKRLLYKDVMIALKEWEQAYNAFQEAVGHDEVDVAIYTLEAAERRYQIQLKAAKQAKLEWDIFRQGSFMN